MAEATMIEGERVQALKGGPERDGRYVLYWMQQSQRASFNPALELAIREANARMRPVVVCFGLTDGYPDANARHYAFMLQGLAHVRDRLAERGITFVIRRGDPAAVALALARDAALVVCDRGYLRHQKQWRQAVAEEAPCPVIQVEGDVVVPVDLVSNRSEYAARTIRPKILRHRDRFMVAFGEAEVARPAATLDRSLALVSDVDLSDRRGVLGELRIDHSVGPVDRFVGGTRHARNLLRAFVDDELPGYGHGRNEPYRWQCSFMSPYLHFGQISPVEVALCVHDAGAADDADRADRAAYLEELIVRRELAMNYVNFTPSYDSYDALPAWARQTLSAHRHDERAHLYSRAELEAAQTHDPFWNAAMREMVHTGFMHNYMRMYWAKKILEWSNSPERGFQTALVINNKYFLDGRDCNSYANVAWCFGLHDRAWTERPIFGKVRYMAASGLRRKFDIQRYVEAVDAMVAGAPDRR